MSYNFHTVKFSLVACIAWVLTKWVNNRCVNTTTIKIENISITPRSFYVPFRENPPLPCLCWALICSVTTALTFLERRNNGIIQCVYYSWIFSCSIKLFRDGHAASYISNLLLFISGRYSITLVYPELFLHYQLMDMGIASSFDLLGMKLLQTYNPSALNTRTCPTPSVSSELCFTVVYSEMPCHSCPPEMTLPVTL